MPICYEPDLIYGVTETKRGMVLDDNFLEENDLEMFAKELVRGYLVDAAYGFSLSVEEYKRFLELGPTDKSNEELVGKMKRIDDFCEKYKFGKGKVMVAISGDYEICDDSYWPKEDENSDE